MAEPTPREAEIMLNAWFCTVDEPKIDYDKLARLCNMTNPKSASNAVRAIKTKYAAKCSFGNADDVAGKKGSMKRGAATSHDKDADHTPPPAKKSRAAHKKKQSTPVSSREASPELASME